MVNEMGAKVWKDNLGVSYYSFVYKNVLFLCLDQQEGRDSRPKPCGLTPEQTQWALDTLKKHSDVRWTMIFVHSPWTWNEAPFKKLEQAMGERDYTVFSGDFHCYSKFQRRGRNYYLLATAGHQTVLTHSSCVRYKGKAYIFLGKSGTGKSTHSRMWLSALDGVELMNDDHPIIRINKEGQAIVYGSPWSGKTHCYKNVQAPLGGIIRIARAPYNKASRLAPVQAYGSLLTSCSGMTWERDLADGRDMTIQGIIRTVPSWVMECLPDQDAALVCSKSVTEGC
jgi:hypothetical protein